MWKLDNWSLQMHGGPYTPPENQTMHLVGQIYGRDLNFFPDGKKVRTSSIEGYDSNTGEVITRSGSRYTLGDVHPEQEKLHPNSKERLLKVLLNLQDTEAG